MCPSTWPLPSYQLSMLVAVRHQRNPSSPAIWMYGVGIHLSPVDSQSSAHTVHVTGKSFPTNFAINPSYLSALVYLFLFIFYVTKDGKHFIFAEEKLECSGLVSNQQQIPKCVWLCLTCKCRRFFFFFYDSPNSGHSFFLSDAILIMFRSTTNKSFLFFCVDVLKFHDVWKFCASNNVIKTQCLFLFCFVFHFLFVGCVLFPQCHDGRISFRRVWTRAVRSWMMWRPLMRDDVSGHD